MKKLINKVNAAEKKFIAFSKYSDKPFQVLGTFLISCLIWTVFGYLIAAISQHFVFSDNGFLGYTFKIAAVISLAILILLTVTLCKEFRNEETVQKKIFNLIFIVGALSFTMFLFMTVMISFFPFFPEITFGKYWGYGAFLGILLFGFSIALYGAFSIAKTLFFFGKEFISDLKNFRKV